MTSFLTALSLLAHMLLGCCWHHEHPGVPAPAVAATAPDREQAHACPCSHHHGGEEPTAPVHDEDPCDEDQCVTAFRDSVSGLWGDGVLPAIDAEVTPAAESSGLLAVSVPVGFDIVLPLRTHLMLQVLLI